MQLLLFTLIFTFLLACSAGGVRTEIDGPDAAPTQIEQVPLQLDPLSSNTTYWTSIPIYGHGPAEGTLIVTTREGISTTKIGASGSFCSNVVLTKGESNQIEFEAIAANGKHSKTISLQVTQFGQPPDLPDPTPSVTYVNTAHNAQVTEMTVSIEEGDVAALTDGDSSGAVHIRNNATELDWIVFELSDSLPIQKLRIRTTSDCPMEYYRILLSDSSSNENPLVYDPLLSKMVYGDSWTMVAAVKNGSSDQSIVPFIDAPIASRMAIEFVSGDCGSTFGTGLHKITEVEVWGRQKNSPPPTGDPAPRCPGN